MKDILRLTSVLSVLSIIPHLVYADDANFESRETLLKVDYLQVPINNNPDMGLIGLHYEENFIPIDNLYTGIGLYSAVAGDIGGYFALGIDNDYFLPMGKYLALNPGIFVGGGGARSAGFGDGLIVMPHLGLDINLSNNSQLGLNYSYTTFPNSSISASQQFMLSYQYRSTSYVLPFDSDISNLSNMISNTPLKSHNMYLEPMLTAYVPRNSTSLNQQPLTKTILLPGAEGGYKFDNNLYVFARLSGAAYGGVNGYMDVLGGAGYKLDFNDTFGWKFELAAGAGGGGTIDTGGGLLVNPATGLEINLSNHWAINGTVGYLAAPTGSFQAITYNAGLKYNFNEFNPDDLGKISNNEFALDTWRFNLYNQTITDAQRNNGASGAINQISFGVDQFLNENFFINYNANFAYNGQNSGGMASGTLGPGAQLNLGKFHPYLIIPVGEIGGGGIDAGDGLIVEPSIGTFFDLTRYFSLNAGVGVMQSFNGSLQTPFVNAGISYRFATLTTSSN